MSRDNNHDLLKFIFGDSQVDADVAASLNEAEATARNSAKKTPLIKALKELGIETENMKVDESGCWLTMTDADAYHAAVKALGSVEAVNSLADRGWVVSFSGDVADTTELPEYTLNFLCLDEPNVSELDKPVTSAQLNKDFKDGSDVVPNDVAEAVDAEPSGATPGRAADADGVTSDCVKAIMNAGRALNDCADRSVDTTECVPLAKAFFDALATCISFHPDSDFADYTDGADKPIFTTEEADVLDAAMARALALDGFDAYAYGAQVLNPAANGGDEPAEVKPLVDAVRAAGMEAEVMDMDDTTTVLITNKDGSTFDVTFRDGKPDSVIAISVDTGDPSDAEGDEALQLITTDIPAFISRFNDW